MFKTKYSQIKIIDYYINSNNHRKSIENIRYTRIFIFSRIPSEFPKLDRTINSSSIRKSDERSSSIRKTFKSGTKTKTPTHPPTPTHTQRKSFDKSTNQQTNKRTQRRKEGSRKGEGRRYGTKNEDGAVQQRR